MYCPQIQQGLQSEELFRSLWSSQLLYCGMISYIDHLMSSRRRSGENNHKHCVIFIICYVSGGRGFWSMQLLACINKPLKLGLLRWVWMRWKDSSRCGVGMESRESWSAGHGNEVRPCAADWWTLWKQFHVNVCVYLIVSVCVCVCVCVCVYSVRIYTLYLDDSEGWCWAEPVYN